MEDGYCKDGQAVPSVLPDQAGDVPYELPEGIDGILEFESLGEAFDSQVNASTSVCHVDPPARVWQNA